MLKANLHIYNTLNPSNKYSNRVFIDTCKTAYSTDYVSFRESRATGLTKAEKDYFKKVNEDFQKEGTKLHSLTQLDLTKIPNLCKGIKVFDGWTPEQMALFSTNLTGISLQSGCINHCDHCYMDAGIKISTMQWNNYKDLVDGMGEITNRLGFNPFLSKYYSGNNLSENNSAIRLYSDSDPMWFSFKETNAKNETVVHNIYNAASYLYQKTGLKTDIITAGWNPNNDILQKGAEELAKHPELVNGNLYFSIHPFHQLMHHSINYAKLSAEEENKGNIEKANNLAKLSETKRREYVNNMASNIATFLKNDFPVKSFVYYSKKDNFHSKEETQALVNEIKTAIIALLPDKAKAIDEIFYPPGEISYRAGRAKKDNVLKEISTVKAWIEEYNSKFPNTPISVDDNFFEKSDLGKLEKKLEPLLDGLGLTYVLFSSTLGDISYFYNFLDNDQELIENLDKSDILYARKLVGIDGDILIDLPNTSGLFAKLIKLPFKLNFSEKTNWRVKKPEFTTIPQEKLNTIFPKMSLKDKVLSLFGK